MSIYPFIKMCDEFQLNLTQCVFIYLYSNKSVTLQNETQTVAIQCRASYQPMLLLMETNNNFFFCSYDEMWIEWAFVTHFFVHNLMFL